MQMKRNKKEKRLSCIENDGKLRESEWLREIMKERDIYVREKMREKTIKFQFVQIKKIFEFQILNKI